ncbi:MAG: alpha/beta hydrolase [Proteobacteria bacterium]|nr:alpha/beta hydrolase [Pseudomonadota bacterium]MDA1057043.1 alpha/beta hydrolase [Pseudomonadota bacterium]
MSETNIDAEMRFWRTPAGVRRAYADGRFGQLHYRIARPTGATDKTPLICFHLSPNSGRVYALWLAEMSKDRIAVAPDTPGFGESDAPPSAPDIADYAAAMGELIDHLGFDQVDVMGYHTGSRTCVEIAQQRPQQIRRIVLVSAPIYSKEELEVQYKTMGTPSSDETTDDGSHLQRKWDGHLRWKDRAAPLVFVHREVCEALRGGNKAWWGHHAAFRLQHAEHLPNVKQPVLALCPNDDLRVPTLRAKEYIQNGRVHELPDYAHGMLDVHTTEVASVVRDFLDGPAADIGTTQSRPTPPLPPTPPKRAIRRAFMDGPDGGQVHYRTAMPSDPAQTPLMCLHMSPNSGRIYEAILQDMGTDRVAVAPDMPGFGESDAPNAPPEIADYARIAGHVADNLGLKRIDVMGYHTGSETCIELALQRPDLVRRIVQISCPVFTDAELEELRRGYAAAPLMADGSHLVGKWRHMLPFYGPKVPREVMARNFAEGLRGGPVAHWGHRAAFNYDLRESLPRVTQPILVINPNDDLVEQTPRGLPLMKNGRVFEIKDRGHGFIDTMTAEFAKTLRGFLDVETV